MRYSDEYFAFAKKKKKVVFFFGVSKKMLTFAFVIGRKFH